MSATPIKAFVHLARSQDAEGWRAAHKSGSLVGINDETPYGYGRAERMGCAVQFSQAGEESRFGKVLRLTLRLLLGFDVVHAWRQRAQLASADVIWAHTESQYLAVASVLSIIGARTPLIGQSVWLLDRWPKRGPLFRALCRRLVRRVDIMTFLSPLNRAAAAARFPWARTELVLFGIIADNPVEPAPRDASPLRVLAIGNDQDRDWGALIKAVGGLTDVRLTILSWNCPQRLAAGVENVEIRPARTNDELNQAFAIANVICVPLRPNLHASGITVLEEGVLLGIPVVASDVGGLDAYFARDEVRYVPPGDPMALRAAILDIAADPQAALAQASKAQRRMRSGEISMDAYVRRHVELSRDILAKRRGRLDQPA